MLPPNYFRKTIIEIHLARNAIEMIVLKHIEEQLANDPNIVRDKKDKVTMRLDSRHGYTIVLEVREKAKGDIL